MITKTFSEVFARMVSNLEDSEKNEDKLKIIRDFSNEESGVLKVFDIMLNKDIVFDLPKGKVSFKAIPQISSDYVTNVFRSVLRGDKLQPFYMKNSLSKTKKEVLFVSILEQMDTNDSEFLIDLKDKNIPKGISREIIIEAFPQWKKAWDSGENDIIDNSNKVLNEIDSFMEKNVDKVSNKDIVSANLFGTLPSEDETLVIKEPDIQKDNNNEDLVEVIEDNTKSMTAKRAYKRKSG